MPEEEAVLIFASPEVANDPANHKVLSADRSPPPAKAKPVLMAREEDTAVMPSVKAPVVLL